eukprot:CAMPEP_0171244844 /NCGR_PEP_ID=MMETSP0790-20130122/47081_1 /TAXON_ID=2925 /ORGANISM="Alexandrium catenella, Strain OF101" /LENGTH=51 /DNA_ID=CAMNT_0011712019 /DNA_START=62 /DNA_END=214 /DNA_ORIENTATION=-
MQAGVAEAAEIRPNSANSMPQKTSGSAKAPLMLQKTAGVQGTPRPRPMRAS